MATNLLGHDNKFSDMLEHYQKDLNEEEVDEDEKQREEIYAKLARSKLRKSDTEAYCREIFNVLRG